MPKHSFIRDVLVDIALRNLAEGQLPQANQGLIAATLAGGCSGARLAAGAIFLWKTWNYSIYPAYASGFSTRSQRYARVSGSTLKED